MAKKDDQLSLDGVVTEVLPQAMFRVTLENGSVILCHISGKIRQNKIQILEGDQVQVECSVYDLSRGRIVYRGK